MMKWGIFKLYRKSALIKLRYFRYNCDYYISCDLWSSWHGTPVTCDHRDLEPLNRYAVTTPSLISCLWLTCVSHNIFHIGVFVLCGLLFVHVILFSSIFFWPLCCLLFCALRLMVTPLVFYNLWLPLWYFITYGYPFGIL
jgi:hypothetical protein